MLLPAILSERVDALRRAHDPLQAAAIPPHVTDVHDLTPEQEARVPGVVEGRAPFRVRMSRPVRLDDLPARVGVAFGVDDLDGGHAGLRAALGAPAAGVPHVTVLNPRNVRDAAHTEEAWTAANALAIDEIVIADALCLMVERGGRWAEIRRFALGSRGT